MGNQAIGETLFTIYRRLLAGYGAQHWWPAAGPFEVMVGAILTQSAAWSNVEKAIARLKSAGALSPAALRQLPLAELAELVRSSGYYNAKARKLKSLVQWLGDRYEDNLGRLFTEDVGRLREHLLAIYGIGYETADSIILYAAGQPIFVIDAYTRRIITRLGLSPADTYEAFQSLFMDNLPHDVGLFNEYHALLVCLGKNVCRSRPLCRQCCLSDMCPHHAQQLDGGSRLD